MDYECIYVALKLDIFSVDCVHLCMDLHFCIYVRGCKKQHGLLLPLICGGDLLFWSRKLEGWKDVCSGGKEMNVPGGC